MQKKQVCVLFCVSLLFLKLFFFLPRRQRAGPGPTGNGPGRAGPDLPGTATGRAEKNGPVQASSTHTQDNACIGWRFGLVVTRWP